MNVATLRLHFRNIAAFLESASGSKTALSQLDDIDAALVPFESKSLGEFAELLVQAEKCIREGAPFVFEKTTKGSKGKAKPKAPKIEPSAAIVDILEMFRTIASSNISDSEAQSRLQPIDKLKKPDLQKLAEGMNIWHTMKKPNMDTIKARIRGEFNERKARFTRSDY